MGENPEVPLVTKEDHFDDKESPQQHGKGTLRKAWNWLTGKFTPKQWHIIFAITSSNLSVMSVFSMLGPIYPPEAELRNVTLVTQGWVFGSYAASQVVICPLFGVLISFIGTRRLFTSGLILGGLSAIGFGCVNYLPMDSPKELYVGLVFLFRITGSIGSSAAVTSTMPAICQNFSKGTVMKLVGYSESLFSVGILGGPAVAGFLYEAGGFIVPFATFGVLLLLTAVAIFLVVPEEDPNRKQEKTKYKSAIPFLFNFRSLLASASIMLFSASASGRVAIFEVFLRFFGLRPSLEGLVFSLSGVGLIVTSVWVGSLCKLVPDTKILMTCGHLIFLLGYMLVGPSPLMNPQGHDPHLWLVIVAVSILGPGASLIVVPAYGQYLKVIERLHMKRDLTTTGIISGLFNGSAMLGDFLGPPAMASLSAAIGFPWTMTAAAGVHCVLAILQLVAFLYDMYFSKNPVPEESIALLDKSERPPPYKEK